MTSDRWSLLSVWLNQWAAADEDTRARLRAQLAADHPELVAEAESLARASGRLGGFLETPALVLEARSIATEDPVLTSGVEVGPYRIAGLLARGGTGDVYRATDTRLRRDVALKVLSHTRTSDPHRVERFMHEARLTASLDHANVVRVYDVGRTPEHTYLVAELLEGETLRARIERGPMPVNEVLRIALEISNGLAAAHAAGLVHRDLKPDNVFLTRAGVTKILDFGIAKLAEGDMAGNGFATMTGVVLGTAGYLAPEQIRGLQVDARADLFALGTVLSEMLTGVRAFGREHMVETLHAILHDPPSAALTERPDVPPALAHIVMRLLQKAPSDRFASAADAINALQQVDLAEKPPAPARKVLGRRRFTLTTGIRIAAAVAVGVGLVALALVSVPSAPNDGGGASPSLRWEQLTNFTDSASVPAVSPNGKVVAFIRGPGRFGTSVAAGEVWIKTLPDGEAVQLTNTRFGKHTLAFSPDGSRIYFTQVEGRFSWSTYEVSLHGPQQPRLVMANATGLTFVGKDRVLFSEMKEGIHMSLATSNLNRTDKRDVYVPPDTANGMVHRSALSPDGKWVLAAEMDSRWWVRCRLLPFDGSSTGREVGPDGSCTAAQWSPDGQWMYLTVESGSTGFHIWRQRFPNGTPEQLTPRGASEEEGLAVWPDGKSLITAAGAQEASIWIRDDKGSREITSEGFAFLPTLSPDGKRLYYLRRTPGSRSFLSGELYAADVATGRAERILPGMMLSHYSLSHDGAKLAIVPETGGRETGIWLAAAVGGEPPRQISSNLAQRVFFSASGEIFYESGSTTRHVMRIGQDGSGERQAYPRPIVQLMSVSPDGRWAMVGTAEMARHGMGSALLLAVPLSGGEPITICDYCVLGFDSVRIFSSFATWSYDGKWIYIPLRYFDSTLRRTLVLPFRAGAVPAVAVKGLTTEEEFARIPGALLIDEKDVAPGLNPSHYAFARGSAKTNLFRIYLQ